MSSHPRPSPEPHPPKRRRPSSPDKDSPSSIVGGAPSPSTETSPDGTGHSSKVGQSSSFRNVSACNRCRLRKNRCDQKLPSCASCEKAGVACVGYDPITKREIPRSYVFYLETRVEQLEALLRANNIQFPPASNLEHCSRPGAEGGSGQSLADNTNNAVSEANESWGTARSHSNGDGISKPSKPSRHSGGSGQRHPGSANGVSFARVVFAAVQSSVGENRSNSEKAGIRPYKLGAENGAGPSGTSMRDSFFGLHTRPTIHAAPFPDREIAEKLVNLYFEHANPQIPVIHRCDFMKMFELAYADEGRVRGPKELYMLNMVFAIGGGIIMDGQAQSTRAGGEGEKQAQPEEYHASAIVHLEACLSNSGGGLEELQAVLLLANFALLRPVPPGLWYIVGVAVRLAIDLGLHYEDGKDVEFDFGEPTGAVKTEGAAEKSREALLREKGRHQVITTEFPSMLDDRYITPAGFTGPPPDGEPSYKMVAKHYFRLRLLQSEILQVLQYQQAQIARRHGQNLRNEYMHTDLRLPFLQKFDSFRSWRRNIDERLYGWKNSAPTKKETGVAFSPEFLELNYWQAIIMLYRQSLSVPSMFEGEYNTSKEVNSPSVYTAEQQEDEERVYLKVAEAGQKILRLYRQLHVMGLVNYTYLATHHLFMAGVSYLYAIWHSHVVRSRLTMDEVDFTILAATSVFSDLISKCPPAETCRDAFDRTAKATIKMAQSTGGFGQVLHRKKRGSREHANPREATAQRQRPSQRVPADHGTPRTSRHYDTPTYDSYSSTQRGAQTTPSQAGGYRLSIPNAQAEQDAYAMLQTRPAQALSTGSGSDVGSIADNSAIDPVLLPSPRQGQSPASAASLTPSTQASQYPQTTPGSNFNMLQSPSNSYNPGGINYSDLQGIDFLQGLQEQASTDYTNPDLQMDMGFGLGWEATHHDFSEGQQVDLFGGFFFGGQQGGLGGPG
ncbi:hypothetical protein DL766_010379 [Monosporascus sp. MC13-8B]|uniref:Zn(2)-C6 fungal-type domain-containing protein n=1 Tax=Monosporascus cannonballus TaxID=155416 RepID=A0ABY0GWL6_9PEZI|nr:hypothetical protein DL762_009769 [Monosporascus cannonballus]RYO99884.1 hypothetical protein DL763_001167 [Monosporascus cannonballus]RYP02403.1 hypothetical protein DL766_010379 [Monosporascus sp. MC13-8B]